MTEMVDCATRVPPPQTLHRHTEKLPQSFLSREERVEAGDNAKLHQQLSRVRFRESRQRDIPYRVKQNSANHTTFLKMCYYRGERVLGKRVLCFLDRGV